MGEAATPSTRINAEVVQPLADVTNLLAEAVVQPPSSAERSIEDVLAAVIDAGERARKKAKWSVYKGPTVCDLCGSQVEKAVIKHHQQSKKCSARAGSR